MGKPRLVGSFAAAVALVAVLLAGCAAPRDLASAADTQPQPAPILVREWRFVSWDNLGDWAARLQVAAAQETTCSATLEAQGVTDGDQPEFMVGFMHEGASAVEENSRDLQPMVATGLASTSAVSQTMLIGYGPGGGFPANATFGPGPATFFWAASGVRDVGLGENGTAVAALACDGLVEIAGRGVTFRPLLWNDQTFGSDGYVSPGFGGYGGGELRADSPDPYFFAFTKFQQENQTLRLSSPSWNQTWDLSGDDRVDVARGGVAGPVALALHTFGFRPTSDFRPPWTSGLLAAFEDVDLLPFGHESTDVWEGRPPGA